MFQFWHNGGGGKKEEKENKVHREKCFN